MREQPKNSIVYPKWVLPAWWFSWGMVAAVVLHRFELSWQLAFADAAVFIAILAGSCCAASLIFRNYQPQFSPWLFRLLICLALAGLACWLFTEVMQLVLRENEPFLTFLKTSLPLRFVYALLMLFLQTGLSWMQNVTEEQKRREQHHRGIENLAKEAELGRLRHQLQPHFLFNSLNSVSALAGSDPAQARKMIQQLSDFLRTTLKKDESALVPVREELNQLQLYLEIEKVRFGHRLVAVIDADERCRTCLVPTMLLQPVVENAIKYGLYGTLGQVVISIRMSWEKNSLRVTVRNPYDRSAANEAGTGFGLESLARRLFLLYSRSDLLSVQREDQYFEAIIQIPQ